MWELRANRIDIDTDEGMGVARGATLRIGKVPVLYVPWFMFPIDDRRRTGLLYPAIRSRGRNGFDYRQPIYLNLAPNYDATLDPRYMSDRGWSLGGEFRWLYADGSGERVAATGCRTTSCRTNEPERYSRLNGEPDPGRDRCRKTTAACSAATPSINLNSDLVRARQPGLGQRYALLRGLQQQPVRPFVHLRPQHRRPLRPRPLLGRRPDGRPLAARRLHADRSATCPTTACRAPTLRWAQPFGDWFEAGVDTEAVRFQHDETSGLGPA